MQGFTPTSLVNAGGRGMAKVCRLWGDSARADTGMPGQSSRMPAPVHRKTGGGAGRGGQVLPGEREVGTEFSFLRVGHGKGERNAWTCSTKVSWSYSRRKETLFGWLGVIARTNQQ